MTDNRIKQWLVLVFLAWTIFFSAYAVLLHYGYRSGALDMALHSQLLWNLSRGEFFQTSFLDYGFAANHFWPALYLFLPVFAIGGEYGLIVSEVCIIALGVFPAYFLARDILKNTPWSLVFALCYLLHPVLSIGVLFEFHLEPMTVPVILSALLFLRRRRFGRFAFFCLLAVALYEVTAVVFFFFGLALLFKPGYRRAGAVLLSSAAAYLLIIWKAVMPVFGREGHFPHWVRYAHLGYGPIDAICRLASRPLEIIRWSLEEKGDIKNLFYNFQAFGFLSLLAPLVLLPALPLVAALLVSSWPAQMDIRLGYIAPAVPFFYLAALFGARRLISLSGTSGRVLKKFGMLIPLIPAGILFVYFQLAGQIRGFPLPFRKNLPQIREAAALIPAGAGLSADWHLGSHFGRREVIVLFPATGYRGKPVEYIFLDLDEEENKDENYWRRAAEVVNGDEWGAVYASGGVLLLRRGAPPNDTARRALREILDRGKRFESAPVTK